MRRDKFGFQKGTWATMMNQDSSQLRKKLDEALKDSPYIDPEFEFGEENAKLYNEINSRIPFVVSDVKHQFFGKYMGMQP